MRRYMIIDGSNILHASQGAPKLTVGNTEVQAIFGFLRTMQKLVKVYPLLTPLVLWDGASWRNIIFPDYKIGRAKNDTPSAQKAQAEKKKAQAQLPAIKKALTLVGIDQVRAANMEADDLAAIIADRYVARGDRTLLVSGDQDWLQLIGPGISWFDPINDRKASKPEDLAKLTSSKFPDGIPVTSMQQFVELKALMGDSGDSVPGVGGIGPKGAIEFIQTYGSFADFSNGCLDGSIDVAKLPKKFRDLGQSEDKRIAFGSNMRLVDLRTKARPAPLNLTVTKGEPNIERFRNFCEKLVFRSMLRDLEAWLSPFPSFRPSLEEAA